MSEELRTLFAEHGLRCTRQRQDVYEALRIARDHPTAEELHRRLTRASSEISLATVYNSLEALCSHRLCRRIPTQEGACRFDADMGEHLHITTSDGRMLDVPRDLGERLLTSVPAEILRDIERQAGVRIERLSVELFASPGPDASGD